MSQIIHNGDYELIFNERIALLNDDDLKISFDKKVDNKRIVLFVDFFEGNPSEVEASMGEVDDADYPDVRIYRSKLPLAKKNKLRTGYTFNPIKMSFSDQRDIFFVFTVEGFKNQWNVQISTFTQVEKRKNDGKAE